MAGVTLAELKYAGTDPAALASHLLSPFAFSQLNELDIQHGENQIVGRS